MLLTEVPEEKGPPAPRCLGVAAHRLHPGPFDPSPGLGTLPRLGEHPPALCRPDGDDLGARPLRRADVEQGVERADHAARPEVVLLADRPEIFHNLR